MVTSYQKRIFGPLMDRIDIHVDVPHVAFEKLTAKRRGELSNSRLEKAFDKYRDCFKEANLYCNTDIGTGKVREYCELDETGRQLMKSAMA